MFSLDDGLRVAIPAAVKKQIKKAITELQALDPDTRIEERIAKYSKMGGYAQKEKKVKEKVMDRPIKSRKR